MISPPSPGELWELFKAVKEAVEKIKDAPAVVAKVAKRMRDLQAQMERLKEHFVDNKGQIVKSLERTAADQLRRILGDLYANIEEVKKILGEWDSKKGPLGLQYRFDIVPQIFFALGKNPERLERLEQEIEYHRKELAEWSTQTILDKIDQLKSPPQQLQPRPTSAQTDKVTLIFLDKDNIGRSKIAEAYAKLVQDWTTKAKGDWKIKYSHSAGFNVCHRSECVEQIKNMGRIWPGDAPPHPMAMLALFDNGLFKGDFKDELRGTMERQRSRGIRNTLFKEYDYIIVFTRLMKKNVDALRELLIKQYGPGAAPPGKGKVIVLGQYASIKTDYITPPSDTRDTHKDRQSWNQLVGTIKVSFKNFLKFELDWTPPRV